MIINKLKLHNFGVYASDNEFDFNSDKPVVLIGGMNGRGKTTFLEAVLLALYGSDSFAYKESKYNSYGRYLYNHVNIADGTLQTFVELTFTMDGDRYVVNRSWNGDMKRVREKITVEKNFEFNDFLTKNWPMFIENVLPESLSKFFFFDGEKIAALAEDETSKDMKDAIKAMLGITVLDTLEKDLSRLLNTISKNVITQEEREQIEQLRKIKNNSKAELDELDREKEKLDNKYLQSKKYLEELEASYLAAGGGVLEERQALLEKKTELHVKASQTKKDLIDMAGSDLPLLMVSDLLEDIQKHSEKEIEKKNLELSLKQVTKFYDRFRKRKNNHQEVDEFMDFFKGEVDQYQVDMIYNLSDDQLYHLSLLLNNNLDNEKDNTIRLLEKETKLNKELDSIESDLSVEIDEEKLKRISKDITEVKMNIAIYEVKIASLVEKRTSLNGKAMKDASTFDKYVENVLTKLEQNDENERVIKYIRYAQNILGRYEIKLQERKTDLLAHTMTECYKKLASKKNMIEYIKMDSASLDFTYYDSNDREVPKKSLSAGEKQLMIISLLWALANCSKKKLPVIIDTPLSRLDSEHRASLVKTYFPNASEQTIILSTDSEINHHYYDMMKDYIGDEFLLVYDDIHKNTTISRGYFKEDRA